MKTSMVPRDHVTVVWDRIEKYAEGCAKYTYGRFTAKDMLEGLLTKNQQLWIAFDDDDIQAFWVTEVSDYPQKRALLMHFVGGKNIKAWGKIGLKQLRKFAKDTGCTTIESYGRPGWEKIWQDEGYEKKLVFYELPVE
jgi:hypothetical protein